MNLKLTIKMVAVIGGLAIFAVFLFLFRFQQEVPENKELNAEQSPAAPLQAEIGGAILQDALLYQHPGGRFSFSYPGGFKVGSFEEGSDEEITIVQDAASNLGVQIYSTAFNESEPITKQRILRDLPDLKIKNDRQINIDGVPALEFTGIDDGGGKITKEVWFVNAGRLYQISGFPESTELMEKILTNWRWR